MKGFYNRGKYCFVLQDYSFSRSYKFKEGFLTILVFPIILTIKLSEGNKNYVFSKPTEKKMTPLAYNQVLHADGCFLTVINTSFLTTLSGEICCNRDNTSRPSHQ